MQRHETHATPARLSGDSGAALVEFALIAPLLFLIVFGIIEFGYGYGQSLDVRHGAREGSRLAAVNFKTGSPNPTTQSAQIVSEICNRMQVGGGDGTTVSLSYVTPGANGPDRGNLARVEVRRPLQQITGFLDFALSGVVLESEVETRLEVDATWAAVTNQACP
jgi:Flp pilus assembly protein TadG